MTSRHSRAGGKPVADRLPRTGWIARLRGNDEMTWQLMYQQQDANAVRNSPGFLIADAAQVTEGYGDGFFSGKVHGTKVGKVF